MDTEFHTLYQVRLGLPEIYAKADRWDLNYKTRLCNKSYKLRNSISKVIKFIKSWIWKAWCILATPNSSKLRQSLLTVPYLHECFINEKKPRRFFLWLTNNKIQIIHYSLIGIHWCKWCKFFHSPSNKKRCLITGMTLPPFPYFFSFLSFKHPFMKISILINIFLRKFCMFLVDTIIYCIF